MKFLGVITILISMNVSGQVSVEWFEEEEAPKFVSVSTPSVVGGNTDVFVVRSDNNRAMPEVRYDFYRGDKLISVVEEKYSFKNQPVEPSNFTVVGQNLVRIDAVESENGEEYLLSPYNPESNEIHSSVKLSTYEYNKINKRRKLSFIRSGNHNFLMAYWTIEDSELDKRPNLGYCIVDSSLQIVKEGVFVLPFEEGFVGINKLYLSDLGKPYVIISRYEEERGMSIFRDERMDRAYRKESDRLYVSEITEADNGLFELKVEGKMIYDFELDASGDVLSVVALFGLSGQKVLHGYAQGLASFKVNFLTETNEGEFYSFSNNLIQNNLSLDSRISSSESENSIGVMELSLDQVMSFQNGDLLVILEHRELYPTWPTPNGDRYIARNIIALKFDGLGVMKWVTEVEKRQSCNAYGFSKVSYTSLIKNDEIHFLFNDVSSNYDENGAYIGNEDPDWISLAKMNAYKEVVLAMVSIDFEGGDFHRRVIYGDPESGLSALTKSFFSDGYNGKVLTYSVGKRNKGARLGTVVWE